MKPKVTGHQPRVTRAMLRTAQAEAERRYGSNVSVSVVRHGAAVGQHDEYVNGPTWKQDDDHRYYVCSTCPKTKAAGTVWGTRHWVKAWRNQYTISEPRGAFNLVLGSGFSFADAFAAADARVAETKLASTSREVKERKPINERSVADVPLPAAPRAARMASAPRSRRRSTSTIPPVRHVTGQQQSRRTGQSTHATKPRVRCQDCGVAIPSRTRCNRCALRHWRATHPAEKRIQDQRYRAKRPARVRALVRARVTQWRKRQKKR
jgi:hypothetical protein